MSYRGFWILLAVVATIGQVGCSLGLRQDYIYDRNMTYSPDDPFVRGDVYKTHIGHDGFNYNCDQEEQKRYLPWIQWRQRPCDSQSCSREIREYIASYDHAACRWKMGSCQVCRPQVFTPGAGYGNEVYSNDSKEASDSTAPASLIESQKEKDPNASDQTKSDYAKDIVPQLMFDEPAKKSASPASASPAKE